MSDKLCCDLFTCVHDTKNNQCCFNCLNKDSCQDRCLNTPEKCKRSFIEESSGDDNKKRSKNLKNISKMLY